MIKLSEMNESAKLKLSKVSFYGNKNVEWTDGSSKGDLSAKTRSAYIHVFEASGTRDTEYYVLLQDLDDDSDKDYTKSFTNGKDALKLAKELVKLTDSEDSDLDKVARSKGMKEYVD